MGLSVDLLVLGGSFFVYSTIGWVFLHLLFATHMNDILCQIFFCLTFAVSLSLFQLVIFEVLGVLAVETRWWAWKIDLAFMIFDLVVSLPFLLFWSLIYDYTIRGVRGFALSALVLVGFVVLFFQISPFQTAPHLEPYYGPPPPDQLDGVAYYRGWDNADGEDEGEDVLAPAAGLRIRPDEILNKIQRLHDQQDDVESVARDVVKSDLFSECLGRIGIIGVSVMAVLAGFGAVATPRGYLSHKAVPAVEGHEANQRLQATIDALVRKKRQEALCAYRDEKEAYEPSGNGGGWLASIASTVTSAFGNGSQRELDELRLEVSGLEKVAAELFEQLHEIKTLEDQQRFSKTPRGKVFTLLGYIMSVYCLYKTLMAAASILLDRVAKVDPITRGLGWVGIKANCVSVVQKDCTAYDLHAMQYVQMISLLAMAIMIGSSVRGFLCMVQKIVHYYCKRVSPKSIAVLFGYLMGAYSVSTIMLLRMNLPEQYRGMLEDVMGQGIRFTFFHRWFDVIFLFSVLLSYLILSSFDKTRKDRLRDVT